MKDRILTLLSALLVALATSCLPSGSPGGGSSDGNNGGGNNETTTSQCEPAESEQCQVFELVNIERNDRGEEPLEYNSALELAAQRHAEDMYENDYFSHTSQDGRDFGQRAEEAGYSGSPGGENIALGQNSAEQVMTSWMNSDGHRRNILDGNFDEIGVGFHNNYWVQVFGVRR